MALVTGAVVGAGVAGAAGFYVQKSYNDDYVYVKDGEIDKMTLELEQKTREAKKMELQVEQQMLAATPTVDVEAEKAAITATLLANTTPPWGDDPAIPPLPAEIEWPDDPRMLDMRTEDCEPAWKELVEKQRLLWDEMFKDAVNQHAQDMFDANGAHAKDMQTKAEFAYITSTANWSAAMVERKKWWFERERDLLEKWGEEDHFRKLAEAEKDMAEADAMLDAWMNMLDNLPPYLRPGWNALLEKTQFKAMERDGVQKKILKFLVGNQQASQGIYAKVMHYLQAEGAAKVRGTPLGQAMFTALNEAGDMSVTIFELCVFLNIFVDAHPLEKAMMVFEWSGLEPKDKEKVTEEDMLKLTSFAYKECLAASLACSTSCLFARDEACGATAVPYNEETVEKVLGGKPEVWGKIPAVSYKMFAAWLLCQDMDVANTFAKSCDEGEEAPAQAPA